jgi:hypothetical protein
MSQKTQINQKEIELEISKHLDYGDLINIAHVSGIEYSYLKSQLNSNDPRMSHIVSALKQICALRQINEEKGQRVWKIICREWEKAAPTLELSLCVKHETGQLSKEVSEFVAAKLDGLPYNKQLSELIDIEKQLKRTKHALINEFHQSNSTTPVVRSMKVK